MHVFHATQRVAEIAERKVCTMVQQGSTGKGPREGRRSSPGEGRRRGRDRKRMTRGGNEGGGGNEPSASSGSVGEGRLKKEKARGGEKCWGNANVPTAAAAACRCLLVVTLMLMRILSDVLTLSSTSTSHKVACHQRPLRRPTTAVVRRATGVGHNNSLQARRSPLLLPAKKMY